MAQHTETVYASDSWAENYTYTTLIETVRGASLTSQERYSFTSNGSEWDVRATSHSSVHMKFSGSAQYRKKRLKSADLYVYITAAAGSGSGTFKNGRFIHSYDNLLPGGIYSIYTAPAEELSNLGKNQYHRLFSKKNFSDTNLSQGYIEMYPNVYTAYTGSMYNGYQYTSNASMTMHSHTGTNRPYTIFTYEDVVPEVRDCAPKSGFVNEKASTVFRWKFFANQNYVQQPVKQQGYQFRWRVTGQSSYKESTVTSTSESHTVPAGTFPEKGSIDWCVRVQSDDGIWSEWSSWFTLTTTDSLSVPAQLRPNLGYVDGNQPQIFSWKHVIETGTAQSKFEIQYRTAGEDWETLWTGEGTVQETLLLQNTLPSGKGFWRVRTGNSDGVLGGWSEEASIIVRASPPEPVIGQLNAAPRPLIRWQAQDQQGYQVRIGEIDSLEQYGTEKEWYCPVYLADGSYQVSVRVQNEFGLWSPWASAQFTVQNRGTGRIVLSGRTVGKEIMLSWNTSGTFLGFLVKRDGRVIASTKDTTYFDRMCGGLHQYELIGQIEGGHYVSSGVLTKVFSMRDAALSGWDGREWILFSVRRDGAPVHKLVSEAQIGYQQYYGYDLPVAEISKSQIRRHQLAFSLQDSRTLTSLQALVGHKVIYKDQWGSCFAGILESLTVDYKNNADISFIIMEAEQEKENEE